MFIVVGTNHKFSPIELRERIAFSKNRLKEALLFLKEYTGIRNAVILSTCNRVEVYCYTSELILGAQRLKEFLSRYHEIDLSKLNLFLYVKEEEDALRHLFLVSSGLDSLILGETQVLGQVKSSFLEAERAGFVDRFLKEVFYSAFSVAKKVYSQTDISEGKVSVGSVALDFIKERVGSLSGKNILIIGVGKVTELVLRYLEKESPNVVFISNRTFEKAVALAETIGAKAVRFDRIKDFLKGTDIIITATSSPHFIIRKETLEEVISHKPSAISHKLIIIDLALPRDVEPKVKEIKNVELFCLEDLGTVIQKNLEKKNREAEKARILIDREVEILWRELLGLEQGQVSLH